ncbi:PAS domain-containing sensor histidine kinase [Dissulfurimicrobium hydrothermale]|uniref:PAS domain-containing sensor histidine kinase n=1 Tax=Dissulfurimicrobium hydrothermale TaxID=1750598 RepID=UPI001EDB0F38|nr:PAS domain-containing sensor histidine kinase [Dissulfurimicrobium hydrothermale]UKL14364.1 PAS domain S-box protein [Dissulfurimicrobium hydrothermale]
MKTMKIKDWKAVLDSIPDMICLLDREYRLIYINRAMKARLDHQPEIIGRPCYEVIYGREAPVDYCPLAMLLVDGKSHTVEITGGPLGEYVEVNVSPLHDEKGALVGAIHVAHDITTLKKTQKDLKKSEERYLDLLENANDLIQSVAPDGSFIYVNRAWLETLGYTVEEVARLKLMDVWAPECQLKCQDMFKTVLSGGSAEHIETSFIAKDGRRIILEGNANCHLDEQGRPLFTRGIFRDITERKRVEEDKKRLEERLHRTKKIEAIGVLAGGIAHQFNNILAGILGYTEICLTRLPDDSPLKEFLLKIEQGVRRAAELTSKMLAYSGQAMLMLKELELAAFMREQAHLIRNTISKKAELKLEIQTAPILINGDPTQLKYMVIDLAANASEALNNAGGLITIKVGTMYADRQYISQAFLAEDSKEDEYAFIEVSDTGIGMDEETMARIFDPFFTTKFTGRGLGMAAVLGIVKGHNGMISVSSRPSLGTTVKVLFPLKRPGALQPAGRSNKGAEIRPAAS